MMNQLFVLNFKDMYRREFRECAERYAAFNTVTTRVYQVVHKFKNKDGRKRCL